MRPNDRYIKLENNIPQIVKLLDELVFTPRLKALQWSTITKQTPNLKIGYPGQHLASLITGIEGARTGARGDDLKDGTEVKSCSRVDQLDTCTSCKGKVLRIEASCPHCGSSSIKRMKDSKWLFTIRSESELDLLTKKVDRILLIIADYPSFLENDFNIIRLQAFEIWNNTERHINFSILVHNYYYKIYLEHIRKNPKKTPAPKNFWPYSYQFYMCNPIKVFECITTNANTTPQTEIIRYVEPHEDRSSIKSELMPIALLEKKEIDTFIERVPRDIIEPLIIKGYSYEQLLKKKSLVKTALPFLNEEVRSYLELRNTDVPIERKTEYKRRG